MPEKVKSCDYVWHNKLQPCTGRTAANLAFDWLHMQFITCNEGGFNQNYLGLLCCFTFSRVMSHTEILAILSIFCLITTPNLLIEYFQACLQWQTIMTFCSTWSKNIQSFNVFCITQVNQHWKKKILGFLMHLSLWILTYAYIYTDSFSHGRQKFWNTDYYWLKAFCF